jgi:hypothetical protein
MYALLAEVASQGNEKKNPTKSNFKVPYNHFSVGFSIRRHAMSFGCKQGKLISPFEYPNVHRSTKSV